MSERGAVISSYVTLCLVFDISRAKIIQVDRENPTVSRYWRSPFIGRSALGVFEQAAISSNRQECSEIGADLLRKGGSAVDSAIGVLLCDGVASIHAMGIGGGCLMTIWDAEKKEAAFLNCRETAPAAAYKEMFINNHSEARYGGKAVAVPGEIAGYWEAHQRYGKLSWKDIFKPVIDLCKKGLTVNYYLAKELEAVQHLIRQEPSLADILVDKNGNTWRVGYVLRRPKLAATLELIAEQGPAVFYKGEIAKKLVEEIRNFGGIMTLDDLANYKPQWKDPIKVTLGEYTIYTSALPGSGIVLQFILRVLHGLVPVADENLFWERMIESYKWAYAGRAYLADDASEELDGLGKALLTEEYVHKVREEILSRRTSFDPTHYGLNFTLPDDAGTSHVAVLAPDGSAVSVTSTINQVMGAMIRSRSTGIIFNDQMDDFSFPGETNGFGFPPSPKNFIKPGKRPMSSMVPTIVLNSHNEVVLVIGAAGGSQITTAVAQAIVLNLWSGYNIKEAMDAPRMHHQLYPMRIAAETDFVWSIRKHLSWIGHNVTDLKGMCSTLAGISKLNHPGITANADRRRQGGVAGF